MPTFRQADWYTTPHYYDILLQDDSAVEGAFLEAVHERFGKAGKAPPQKKPSVLEIACGSGRLLVEMAQRGWHVAGVDLAPEMIEYTRKRLEKGGYQGQLQVASMADFRFRRSFDLAHCLISTFRHLLDEKSARETLRCVTRALRRGGLFVLGLHLTQYDYRRLQRERWVAKRGGTKVTCNIQSWPPDVKKRTEHVRARLTIEEKGQVDRMESEWDFRTYDAAQLRRLLRGVPELEHLATYDFTYTEERELDDEQMDCVLVLRKR